MRIKEKKLRKDLGSKKKHLLRNKKLLKVHLNLFRFIEINIGVEEESEKVSSKDHLS